LSDRYGRLGAVSDQPVSPSPELPLPDPALVVLAGASGAGKSSWARGRYAPSEIVSSDSLRAAVGAGEHDLTASVDAFAVLEQIVAARVRRGLTTVVDTLGLDPDRRLAWREQARATNLPAVLVLFETPADVCRRRNSARDQPVPAPALRAQLARVTATSGAVELEGWDAVIRVVTPTDSAARAPAPTTTELSRNGWTSCCRFPGFGGERHRRSG
jgi:predicted kinase